jgi:hypothetical protein
MDEVPAVLLFGFACFAGAAIILAYVVRRAFAKGRTR